ncbi:MAG TPA: dTDP-glucose 4,6-dehydratase [Acidobacteriaceae bacterium]|jgi:dTDP-glucose 4,6-dehydratase|nr:dTDP-glucose 4,6-dehydratase [Acidobacteriaceae bacterium]
MRQPIFVTGGAGFIGSNFVLDWFQNSPSPLVNFDKLTYAGNLHNLESVARRPEYRFVHADVCDRAAVDQALREYRPRAIVHFAAESHVDRSILGPEAFLETNVRGTFVLLEAARTYYAELADPDRQQFRFLHVSTDEVYGSLDANAPAFLETTPYAPNSPYAASKAASDHLVRAYIHTYGLPAIITNCSNNYGPYQFPEKLIPLMITHALAGKPLPIYGDGLNVRDWLYVGDHCAALRQMLAIGIPGETYNIGGRNERGNRDVVESICTLLDKLRPDSPHAPHAALISYVKDRPGHDRRYAINATKLEQDLGWRAKENFDTGLRKTVQWYLDHMDWVESVTSGSYQQWMRQNYQARGAACEA